MKPSSEPMLLLLWLSMGVMACSQSEERDLRDPGMHVIEMRVRASKQTKQLRLIGRFHPTLHSFTSTIDPSILDCHRHR